MPQLKRIVARGECAGGVLVLALLAVSAVAVMAACLLQVSTASLRRQRASNATKQAFYLAEAGLAESYAGLSSGRTGNVGTAERPAAYGAGLFWVEAVELSPDRVELTSTGMVAGGRAVLRMVAERGEMSIASLGLFASRSIHVPGGALLDAYDSEEGYEPPRPGEKSRRVGRLGSNQDVEAPGDPRLRTTVYADLLAGPGLTPQVGRTVDHVGSKGSRPETLPLPEVALPGEPTGAAISATDAVPRLLAPGSLATEALSVAAGAEVIVQGPCTLVAGELNVAPGGRLTFDSSGGAISVSIAGRFSLAQGSWISTSVGDPSRLVLQVRGGDEDVDLSAAGAFHGVLYAPAARMLLGPDFEVFGAAVAEQLVLAAGAKVHFDVHLDQVALDSVLPRRVAWSILDLSPVAGGAALQDPFAILGVERSELPSPAEAHQDQVLHVVYLGLGGALRTYDGLESAFDWTGVSKVEVLERDGESVLVPDAQAGGEAKSPGATAAMNAIRATPPMAASDLVALLRSSLPLDSEEQIAVVETARQLGSSDIRALLEASPPLAGSDLNVLLDAGSLSSSDLGSVLVHSSPLPADVLARVIVAPRSLLSPSDLRKVLAAN